MFTNNKNKNKNKSKPLIKHFNKQRQIIPLKMYINNKILQKNKNNYSPDINGKKYLVIMACHCDSVIKLDTIQNNLKYFAFENTDKIVVNTSGLLYNSNVSEICSRHNNTKYYEISNSGYVDFGKWIHSLNNFVDYNDYDYIIFTNDSFIIHNSINHYLNLIVKYNVELYGYNDSSQTRYHYQSYLFSLRKDVIQLFINRVTDPNISINNQDDVILKLEVNMTDWFSTKKSFLEIGNFKLQQNHNIFFTNDKIYIILKNSGLLPFTKIKRILQSAF